MLFKNAKFFRLHFDFKYILEEMDEALLWRQFSPCQSQKPVSSGWFFIDSYPFINVVQQVLIKMRTEKKLLPSTVIN